MGICFPAGKLEADRAFPYPSSIECTALWHMAAELLMGFKGRTMDLVQAIGTSKATIHANREEGSAHVIPFFHVIFVDGCRDGRFIGLQKSELIKPGVGCRCQQRLEVRGLGRHDDRR